MSMDGRGIALHNVFKERLWMSLKYENVYPRCHEDGKTLFAGLSKSFDYCNNERKHSAIGERTPTEVYL